MNEMNEFNDGCKLHETILRDLMNVPLKPATCLVGRDFVILTREAFRQELDIVLGRPAYEFMDFGLLFKP